MCRFAYFMVVFLFLIVSTAFALDDAELDRAIREATTGRSDLTAEQLEEMRAQIRSILIAKESFAFRGLQAPCEKEIKAYCGEFQNPEEITACLRGARETVSAACEIALRNEYGSKPLKQKTEYLGVDVPAGSYFFYDPYGTVLGAILSAPIVHKGVLYKEGQIRFGRNGLTYAELASDQVINGIRYQAGILGVFFHDNGQVANAILAEDALVHGRVYKAGTQIQFHPSGKVFSGVEKKTGEHIFNPDDK